MWAQIILEILGFIFADSPALGHQQISVGTVEGLSIVYETISLLSTNRSNTLRLGGGGGGWAEFMNVAEGKIWPKGQKFKSGINFS